jgi:hypothetical protein
MLFLKARANGVLKSVPTPEARRAIVASGLPLSVGIAAFEQLDAFRAMADGYLADNSSEAALNTLVAQFEGWARDNAIAVTGEMPENPLLETIRPKWLAGAPLHEIVEIAGKGTQDVCADFYGYSLPWLFHSVSQKFDKATESNRIDALAKAGLLVELGLPGEAASKVFMAGVRSRVAAIELSAFVLDPAASISRIRSSLLNPSTVEALEPLLSAATLEWLQLLSIEHGLADSNPPRCLPFRGVNPPSDVDSLHLRQVDGNAIYLCSTDGRFKARVQPSDGLPFDKVANDHRFIFVREGSVWHQRSRDPRIPA